MTRLLLEICVDTAKGLKAAIDNGADRIELCAALSEGGLTPSPGLMALAAQYPVPSRVMIRPRAGDFIHLMNWPSWRRTSPP
jgi:copper homeostasis protein